MRHREHWLFHFTLWGLLRASKCDPSKKEKGRVPWPLMATVEIINTTTNQKLAFAVGGIFGRARDRGGTCGGDVIASFWAANQVTK